MAEKITVRVASDCGPIKPIHGVCNGPISFGALTDLSRSWKQAGFPFARLHDPEYPHPITVDIPQIFPDFDADADNPANYIFENTDCAVRAILQCNAGVIYRLGTSIEHTIRKIYTDVPRDLDKWADICLHVVMHYCDGWANGMYNAVQYWEIWNEPDLNQEDMWKGTAEQYYALYVTAAKKIKAAFPHVNVGGPALAGYGNEDFVRGFYAAIVQARAPLDFFSWHLYGYNVDEFKTAMRLMRNYADEYGFSQAQMICDEWNYNPETGFALSNATAEEERDKVAYFDTMTRAKCAALYAAVMTAFQEGPVDIACYYDSHPTNLWCGIFDRYGVPTKSFWSFVAVDRLYRLGNSMAVLVENGSGLHCMAAKNDAADCIRILISRYRGNAGSVGLNLDALSAGKWCLCEYRIDGEHALCQTIETVPDGNTYEFDLPSDTVVLLELVRN